MGNSHPSGRSRSTLWLLLLVIHCLEPLLLILGPYPKKAQAYGYPYLGTKVFE
jgi:hypothetical protein